MQVVTFLNYVLQVFTFYFILLAKGISLNFILIASIWSITSIIAIISMLPGGTGARELSLSFLLTNKEQLIKK